MTSLSFAFQVPRFPPNLGRHLGTLDASRGERRREEILAGWQIGIWGIVDDGLMVTVVDYELSVMVV